MDDPERENYYQTFSRDALLSSDGYLYFTGLTEAIDLPGYGEGRDGGRYAKSIIKYDPREKKIVWRSSVDGEYGGIYRIKEASNGKLIVAGEWNDRDNPMPLFFGLDAGTSFLASIDTSGQLIKTVSNLESSSIDDKMSLYPIPASNKIHINGINREKVEYYVVNDIYGRVITKGDELPVNGAIDVSNYKAGLYFISLHCFGRKQTLKFIVHQ